MVGGTEMEKSLEQSREWFETTSGHLVVMTVAA